MPKKSQSVVDTKKYQYGRLKVRGADGRVRHSSGTGDAVAKALLVFMAGGGKIGEVIAANDLQAKYRGKVQDANPGLLRMSVGGSLRAIIRDGGTVKIGSMKIASLKQAVEIPKVEAKANGVKKTARRKPGKRKPGSARSKAPVGKIAGSDAVGVAKAA